MKAFLKTGYLILLFFAVVLSGCSKSPEDAALEICDCMHKTTTSQDLGAMAGNAAECQEIAAKYRGKFSGAELNRFTRTMTNCVMGNSAAGTYPPRP